MLVFDNADPVLNQDQISDIDRSQDYLQFFDCLNSVDCTSCCLMISTEKYLKISVDCQQLELQGLDQQSCQILLQTSELIGTSTEWDTLSDRYQGNPQYLKMIANTISDIFAGKIAKFLTANLLIYGQIETLLSQQLDLLSNAEMSVLLWLAIERKPIDLDRLQSLTNVSINAATTAKIFSRSP